MEKLSVLNYTAIAASTKAAKYLAPKKLKMIFDATEQRIATPGHSAHQRGKAIDTASTDKAERVRALIWCAIELVTEKCVAEIIPEANICVHFEFA
jgi:hypothetical protein